jgi:hypothetical protein
MKRRQQDALLENIIKYALVPPSQQNKITAKPKPGAILEHIIKKTLLTEGVAKIVRTKKEDFELAKKCGADHVFAVVTKRLPESRLSTAIAAACNASGGDPESKKEDVGPDGKYASAPNLEYAINLDEPDQISFISAYYYLYGNVKQLGKRYRVTVLVMNTKNALLKYMAHHQGLQSDTAVTDSSFIAVGNASVKSMKLMLNLIEDRIENVDRKWYLKNKQEIPYPPQAWYDFAKNEFPGVASSPGVVATDDITDDPADQEEIDNVQDDIQEVTDKKVGTSTFTGTWNNTKGIPIKGIFKQRNTTLDGTFSYDATSKRWWFSNGTWKTPDQIRIGTFTENGVFTDGEYQFTNREVVSSMPDVSYRVYHGFKTADDIDTKNNNSKIFAYDASNKVISYYEGTFNLDGNPNNGTLYTDDTKSTITGTFTNGKYVDTTK